MGILTAVIDSQLNAIRANYNTRKAPNSALLLVNYMPILRFLEPYVEISKDEVADFVAEGYAPPVTKIKGKTLTSVPFIHSVPGYGYYYKMTLDNSGRDFACAVFKRSPRSPEQPLLIKVKDKYYRNPNIIPLNVAITDAYNSSMINKYLGKQPTDWEDMSINSKFQEMRCYNYTTSQFEMLLGHRLSTNSNFKLDDRTLKIINTHLFIALSELGHYFSTYRKKNTCTGALAYCYNNEFVPIYYGFNLPSILNDIGSEGVPWVYTLVELMQPTSEIIQKYITIPECCTKIVTRDDKVYRDINGVDLSKISTNAVYYMARQDIFLISKFLTSPAKESNVDKDTYSYRNIMPFLFSDLFDIIAASGVPIPLYYKPHQWLAKVHICDNTTYYGGGKYINFDFNETSSSEEVPKEVYLNYTEYATLMYNNYINHTSPEYKYPTYVDKSLRTFNLLPVAVFDTERRQTLINTYSKVFLDRFFSKVEG